ncbi:hypothetical protein Pcinc_043547 [Petrolisthes cinctipes]|uniref:Uncharacterized protein n=1 Tax=Petrolisthes cinctipes TaxID=88211 RepID=A0AAE1BFF8_PETCI|nr:hypothetical protein Pcinc_043547 [Petrolisthes cinctipes]
MMSKPINLTLNNKVSLGGKTRALGGWRGYDSITQWAHMAASSQVFLWLRNQTIKVDVGGGVVAEVTAFNAAFEVAADEEATAVDAAAEVPAFEVATLLDAAAEVVASAAEAATVLVAGGDASGVAGAGEVRGEVAAGAADGWGSGGTAGAGRCPAGADPHRYSSCSRKVGDLKYSGTCSSRRAITL